MPIDLSALGLGTVVTRIIAETEWVDGELVEESENYFARCEETDAVYYFGEDVTIYEDGVPITGAEAGRTTSYNVCYTKLLRPAGKWQ